MTLKQKIVRCAFLVEIIVVMAFYIFGTHGIVAFVNLYSQEDRLQAEWVALNSDIQNLEGELYGWLNDPFYVERCAREKLAMAREDDQIYIVK